MGLTDREIPWDDLSPASREQMLKVNRVLFQDPGWLPPEGYTVTQVEIPAETWDVLFSDDEPVTFRERNRDRAY